MADLIAFHAYSHRSFLSPSTMIPRPNNHKRSASSGNRSLSPGRTVAKAKSTNDLARIATDDSALNVTSSSLDKLAESNFNTLKDPRLASTSDLSETISPPSHHPDLSSEVAALSVKLIQAINNQTTLDDTLVATRQELEKAQSKLQVLEQENEKYRKDIANEVLVRKTDFEHEILRLKADVAEERAQRALAERGKKNIEQELETLTAALFEEANKMVAAAKLEREAVEKKNEQLRSQIKDTELLLASHQEQLSELKSVMQGMNLSKDDCDSRTVTSTAPSSPAVAQPQGSLRKLQVIEDVPEVMAVPEGICPGPSTSFPHLFRTVCRTDLQAYEDFHDLFVLSKSSKPPSRVASGSYSGLNVMGLASLTGGGLGSVSSSPAKSNQNHSPNGSFSSPQPPSSHIPLKETRFYKRVLLEDIEPTLRLDAAPGISWLTRRTVLSGICEGSLLVEPMPPSSRKFNFPCSLCGERRSGAEHERTHRFRTSESETAQRYPLCLLCLEKVRSCCEFTGYLRLILDGHLRVGDLEEEKDAWEETVRLRERMFWSRIGGGVVPLFDPANDSDKMSPVANAPQHADLVQNSHGDEDEHHQHLTVHESTGVQTETDKLSVSEDPFMSTPPEFPSSSLMARPEVAESQDRDDSGNVVLQQSSNVTENSVGLHTSSKAEEANNDLAAPTEETALRQAPAAQSNEKEATDPEIRDP